MIKTLEIVATSVVALILMAAAAANARTNGPDCETARTVVQAEIDAACPCDGPGVHADHVRCVTKKLRDLSACTPDASGKRSCGPVPRQCAAQIRRLASRSACGRPAETVTCCVPKQHDCAGDSNPGDGKQDGTCTGTTRKCNSISECMVPKCELAATPERCTLVGGTLGNGRDCRTACTP